MIKLLSESLFTGKNSHFQSLGKKKFILGSILEKKIIYSESFSREFMIFGVWFMEQMTFGFIDCDLYDNRIHILLEYTLSESFTTENIIFGVNVYEELNCDQSWLQK